MNAPIRIPNEAPAEQAEIAVPQTILPVAGSTLRSVAPRHPLRLSSTSQSPLSAGPGLADLAAGIADTFNLDIDRVVCARSAGAIKRLLQRERRSRRPEPRLTPSAKRSAGPRQKRALPADRLALGASLGLLDARLARQQTHWVVLVVDAAELLEGLSQRLIEQLQTIERGFLIIALDEQRPRAPQQSADHPTGERAGTPEQYDFLDSRWLQEIGLSYHDAHLGVSPGELADQLRGIRTADRPAVLHLRYLLQSPDHWESSQPESLRALPAGVQALPPADEAANELLRMVANHSRTVGIVESSLADRLSVSDRLASRLRMLPPEFDDEAALRFSTWCHGLVDGGCQPILLCSDQFLRRHLAHLQGLCEAQVPLLILLVQEEPGAPEQSTEVDSQACSHLAYLRLLPRTAILIPKDAWEFRQMTAWAGSHGGPAAIVLPAAFSTTVRFPDFLETIEEGRAEILEDGQDVCLVAAGPVVAQALEAAERLASRGISAAVINARFARPLDGELLRRYAGEVRGIVTLEAGPVHGGFGAAVLESVSNAALTPAVAMTGLLTGRASAASATAGYVDEVVERALTLIALPAKQEPDLSPAMREMVDEDSSDEWLSATSRELRDERSRILSQPLPPTIRAWAEAYSQVGRRPIYLWQWCHRGVELTTLPCVSSEWRAHVCDTKVLSIMINVLLDDVADGPGPDELLEELLKITRNEPWLAERLSPEGQAYAQFTQRVWDEYWARVAAYPHYATYRDLLQYDLSQLFNTIRYSHLLNRNPHLLNMVEHDLYSPHSMMQMSFASVDLMCSSDFPWTELGKLREAIWHSQCMGRIGNLVTTWQREIPSRDFTSGVFAHAVTSGQLTVGDLLHGEPQSIEAAIRRGGHEGHFLRQWRHHLKCLRALQHRFRAFDLNSVIQGLKQLLVTELASRGLK